MRILLIVAIFLLVTFFSCSPIDGPTNAIIENEYSKAASLLNSDIDQAERLAIQSFNKFNVSNNSIGKARLSYLLGLIYQTKGKYTSSIDYLLISNQYFEETGDKKYLAKSLETLGFVNNELGNYSLAVDYLKSALALKSDDEANRERSTLYLAQALLQLGKKDSAIKIVNNLILNIPNENKTLTGLRYGYVGYFYTISEDYEKAIPFLNKSISLNENKENLAFCYNNLSYCYLMKNDLVKASDLVNKTIDFNINYFKSHAYRTKAFINIKKKNLNEATSDLHISLNYNPDHGIASEGYKKIAELYREKGEIVQMSKYIELSYNAVVEKSRLEKEESEIARAVSDKIYKHQKMVLQASISNEAKWKNTSISTGVLLVSVLVSLLYYRRRNNKKIKDSLEDDFREYDDKNNIK